MTQRYISTTKAVHYHPFLESMGYRWIYDQIIRGELKAILVGTARRRIFKLDKVELDKFIKTKLGE